MIFKAIIKNGENTEQQRFQLNWLCMWVGHSVKNVHTEGKSPKSIENYTRAVRHFTATFHPSPKEITLVEIKNYLFRLSKTKNFSPAFRNLYVFGVKYILHIADGCAGITMNISFHTLRGSYATYLNETGHYSHRGSSSSSWPIHQAEPPNAIRRFLKETLAKIPNPLEALSIACDESKQC